MIRQSNSDRSISSCRSIDEHSNLNSEMGRTGSSCSLQSQIRPIQSLPSSIDCSTTHIQHSNTSQQSSPPPLSILKNIVIRCIQSNYHISSNANASDNFSPCDGSKKSTTPWLQFMVLLFISMKMQLLFEHSVCLISLVATRYLAGKKKAMGLARKLSNMDIPLVRTTSATYNSDLDRSQPIQHDCLATPQPSAIQLREDSSHQAFPSQTWSQHDLDIISLASNSKSNGRLEKIDVNAATSNAPPTSSSFLPIYSDESADEWGQFTDFDDREQDLYNVIDDPFKSISKTILKRRGDKFSFQKLDQLQEEEEYDEHDE